LKNYYFFGDDDSYLFNCAVELFKVNFSFVVDIKELKTLGKETLFCLGRWALLHDL
jgi:hypothetical protein